MKKNLLLAIAFVTATFSANAQFDHEVQLVAGDSINQVLLDGIAGYKNVKIELEEGAVFYNEGKLSLPNGVSITFLGTEDNKPVIGVQQFELATNHDAIVFENIELSGKWESESEIVENNYLFNQSVATTVGILEFKSCFIHDFKNSPVRLQSTDTKIITTLTFDDCIIYGPTVRTYSIVHVDAGSGEGKIENINFLNSTVINSGKCLIYSRDTDNTSVTIKNCTLSKVPGVGDYIIDFGSVESGPSEGIVLENVIFGSIAGVTAKGIRSSATITPVNCYTTTDWSTTGNHINDLIEYTGSEDDLFVDPANNNFAIKDAVFAGKDTAGDPRWRAENPSNINNTETLSEIVSTEYYNVAGVRLNVPSKGLNLVRNVYEDGSVKATKVYIK